MLEKIYNYFFFDKEFHTFMTYEFIFLTLTFGVLNYDTDYLFGISYFVFRL